MAAVWPGLAETDDSLVQCVTEIRKALGDAGHGIIKTVPKRGYVFEPGPIRPGSRTTRRGIAVLVALAAACPVAAAFWFFSAALETIRIPVVAVLPFDDMSPEKDLRYLCGGVAEDINTMLSRPPDVRVISRASSFAEPDLSRDAGQVGARLGADCVLDGGVRKEPLGLRIVAQLVDATTVRTSGPNVLTRPAPIPWRCKMTWPGGSSVP